MLNHWYRPSHNFVTILLLPFSFLFRFIVAIRRFLYRKKILKSQQFAVPIIVVGNITVGGTGKTPFVIWLVNYLREKGFKPGIVSRGVGGKQQKTPRWVNSDSDVSYVGDEAVLLARRSGCPIVIGIDRVAAVKELLSKTDCNVVVSDDGLQHYRLSRDVEIAIVDGDRGFGNGSFIPAGPLRESPKRLKEVNFIVRQISENVKNIRKNENEFDMRLISGFLYSVKNPSTRMTLQELKNQTVHAVAAIGNPKRFFANLKNHHIELIEHVFPDHYLYREKDLKFDDNFPIIMTEKDAVKCKNLAGENVWFLPVDCEIDMLIGDLILKKIWR